jgi:hypothetical protein
MFSMLFIGCSDKDDSSGENSASEVEVSVYIEKITTSERDFKSFGYSSEISTAKLSVFDSGRTYYTDLELSEADNNWSTSLSLPTGRSITFVARLFDENGSEYMRGESVTTLTETTESLSITVGDGIVSDELITLSVRVDASRELQTLYASEIDNIKLTAFDSSNRYYINSQTLTRVNGGWSITASLPTNREVQFNAVAFDTLGEATLSGESNQTISSTSSSISIPLNSLVIDDQPVTIKINTTYDERGLNSLRTLKRVQYSDIAKMQITLYDDYKSYENTTPFVTGENGEWYVELFGVPTNRDVRFRVEAFNENDYRILVGEVTKVLSVADSQTITIPLELAENEIDISLPSTEKMEVGEINSSAVRLTFSLINPNPEIASWRIIPDESLSFYGDFNQTEGQLDFRFRNSLQLSVDFIGDIDPSVIFYSTLEVNSSMGDISAFSFPLYKNYVGVSIAPIVDNIFVTYYDDRVEARAVIDSRLLKSEVCRNSFDKFIDFNFQGQYFQNLLTHYYDSIDYVSEISGDEIVDASSLIGNIRYSGDANISKLLALDINNTYETLFDTYKLYFDFRDVYTYLQHEGFQKLLEYHKSEERELLYLLEGFYFDDDNSSTLLEEYKNSIGAEEFSNLLNYMFISPESSLTDDYNFNDGNFSKNGEFYYDKFGADDNLSKAKFHQLIEMMDNYKFIEIKRIFSDSNNTLDTLIRLDFYDSPNRDEHLSLPQWNSQFFKLRDLRVAESFERLYANIESRQDSDSFKRFFELVENRDFLQVLDYYLYPTDATLNSIKNKLDRDVCIQTSSPKEIYYEWNLENNSLPIENRLTNPITIENFNGTLQDTLHLTTSNSDGAEVEYSYRIGVENWLNGDDNSSINVEDNITCATGYHWDSVEYKCVADDGSSASPVCEDGYHLNEVTNSCFPDSLDPDAGTDFAFTIIHDEDLNRDGQIELNLLYGETKSIILEASKKWFDYGAYDLFAKSDLSTRTITEISTGIFEANITAKEVEGVDSNFSFILQNEYHSEHVDIYLSVQDPIKPIYVPRRLEVYLEKTTTATLKFSNPKDHTLEFSVSNLSSSLFSYAPLGSYLQEDTADGVEFQFALEGVAEGQKQIVVTVRDTETDASRDYYIDVVVEALPEALVQVELESAQKYSCNGNAVSQTYYEYTADSYISTSPSEGVYGHLNELEVVSSNSNYAGDSLLSKVVVLNIPVATSSIVDGTYYNYSIYKRGDSMSKVGEVKYIKELAGREFYFKYYDPTNDNSINGVVCEMHRFPEVAQ